MRKQRETEDKKSSFVYQGLNRKGGGGGMQGEYCFGGEIFCEKSLSESGDRETKGSYSNWSEVGKRRDDQTRKTKIRGKDGQRRKEGSLTNIHG